MRFGLSDTTLREIRSVFARYPQIEKGTIYGSRAQGNYKNGSDIDLVLHGSALTLDLLRKIMDDMDDLLLPYRVDLSIWHLLSDPDFMEQIRRVGIVFYEKTGTSIHP